MSAGGDRLSLSAPRKRRLPLALIASRHRATLRFMSNAAKTVTVSAEVEAAFAEATSRGERLVLVAQDGRTLGTILPAEHNENDDLFIDEPYDPEQDRLDSEELARAIAKQKASGEPMIPWEEVRKRLMDAP